MLVVDDDEAIRLMLRRALERESCAVDVASDGVEAVEKLSEEDYGLILLDLMMPRLDGFGVIRYLTEHKQDQLQRVIVMTAMYPAVDPIRSAPVRAVIPKPFDLRQIIAWAREMVSGRGRGLELLPG